MNSEFATIVDNMMGGNNELRQQAEQGIKTARSQNAQAFLEEIIKYTEGVSEETKLSFAYVLLKKLYLDDRIEEVIVERMLSSYIPLVMNKRYAFHHNMILPGVLRYYDIPNVVAAVAPRPVLISNPVNHMRDVLNLSSATESFLFPNMCYNILQRHDAFTVLVSHSGDALKQKYLEWLRL